MKKTVILALVSMMIFHMVEGLSLHQVYNKAHSVERHMVKSGEESLQSSYKYLLDKLLWSMRQEET